MRKIYYLSGALCNISISHCKSIIFLLNQNNLFSDFLIFVLFNNFKIMDYLNAIIAALIVAEVAIVGGMVKIIIKLFASSLKMFLIVILDFWTWSTSTLVNYLLKKF